MLKSWSNPTFWWLNIPSFDRSAEVVDLLTDAAKRLGADAQKLRKSANAAKGKDCGDMNHSYVYIYICIDRGIDIDIVIYCFFRYTDVDAYIILYRYMDIQPYIMKGRTNR